MRGGSCRMSSGQVGQRWEREREHVLAHVYVHEVRDSWSSVVISGHQWQSKFTILTILTILTITQMTGYMFRNAEYRRR